MKSIISLAIFLLVTFISFAQEYPFLSKDLTRKDVKELGGKVNLNAETSFFLENGDKLELSNLQDYLTNPAYKPAFYIESNKKINAIVFEKASAEEMAKAKAMQEKRMEASSSSEVGKPMQPFSTTDMEGNTVDLADYKGKVIVLNFWFIACKPCVMEMPHLNKFVEKFKNDDVIFLAVATDSKTQVDKFLSKRSFDYTIAPNGRGIASKWGIRSYPTNIIIDKEGNIAYSVSGYGEYLMPIMEKKITELIQD